MGSEAVTITPDPPIAQQQVTITPDPPQDKPSWMSRAWNFANKGLISGDTLMKMGAALGPKPPDQKTGESTRDYLTRVQNHIDSDHPYIQALRTFVAGSAKDAYDTASGFTSPLSLGTMGAGAATKIPGAVGAVAKGITGAAGAGFAAAGAGNVSHAISDESQPLANRVQEGLQGGAMVAGGSAGAADSLRSASPLFQAGAKKMYQSALKPSTTLGREKTASLVQTGLENNIPVSAGGLGKLDGLIKDLQSKVADRIASDPTATVNKFKVASRLSDTAQRFGGTVNPNADLEAIGKSGNEFLENQPNEIPATEAQSLKTNTNSVIRKSYGQLKDAEMESQKALVRGIKEELENNFPEIKGMNAQEGKFLGLDRTLDQAVSRIGNHNLLSLGGRVAALGGSALMHSMGSGSGEAAAGGLGLLALNEVVTNPMVQSKLAIALNRVGKVPYSIAVGRVAKYSIALAAAVNASKPSDTQGQQ